MSKESDVPDEKWPIVYDDRYNVSCLSLEKLHVFDAHKWGNIIEFLKAAGLINDQCLVRPNIATKRDLLLVHSKKYLKSLKWSFNVAIITEIPLVAFVPNFLIQMAYLKPMRLQTGGSVLAGKLATERGWAVNVGGGFHHCSADKGGGFCSYADITLLVRFLFEHKLAEKAMIVDLDAHQGNGYQRDFLGEPAVYILDMYNRHIYPRDKEARRSIRRRVALPNWIEDTEYLLKLRANLQAALTEFTPDILVFNAGTDVLDEDPLGNMCISDKGVIARDEYVFKTCRERRIPVVMLTSGGYQRNSARVVADSILNLHSKGLIEGGRPDNKE